MHFSIPETQDCKDDKSNLSYVVYNIHVNGAFHCTVRYKQLHSFHEQLKKAFEPSCLPFFPPKKFFPLSSNQIEERRSQLEKYIQIISQDEKIFNSELFNAFFLNAQQESLNQKPSETQLDVYLMNWQTLKIQASATDNTATVLQAVANAIDLPSKYLPYFAIFMVSRDEDKHVLVRKMQNFEAPYLSLKTANSNCLSYCLVVRKCYWDTSYDDDLIDDRVALNLLYGQTVCDVERGWVQTTHEVRRQLTALQAKGSKREYICLVRTLKFYGYLQFEPCFCNYPQPNTRVAILAGGKELVLKVATGADQNREVAFRVTKIRCWRLTTSPHDNMNGSSSNSSKTDAEKSKFTRFELSFEYLISKDVLKWITINSEQAILISMCLRGMVEELLMKRKGTKLSSATHTTNGRRDSWSYMRRDGSCHQINIPRSVSSDACLNGDVNPHKSRKVHQRNEVSTKNRSLVENDAFDGIGDDDL